MNSRCSLVVSVYYVFIIQNIRYGWHTRLTLKYCLDFRGVLVSITPTVLAGQCGLVILFIVKVCQKLATLRGWILLRHLKGKYYFKLGWDNLARRFYKVTTQENFLSRKKLFHLQEFYVTFFPHNTLYQFFKCMLCCHAFQRADGRPDSYHLVLLPSEGQHNSD